MDIRSLTKTGGGRFVHQGDTVRVFRVNNKPFRPVATLVCESPELRIYARPSYRSADALLAALSECGFTPEVEQISPLAPIVPYYLQWKMRSR